MTATKSHSLFTPEPHYIPGYAGFYPQLRYQVGYTYGRTTAQVLTDPAVNKSPCSVLAPLSKPKFIEDLSQNKKSQAQCMDSNQPRIPHNTGFQPFKDSEIRGHYPPFRMEQHSTPVPDSNRYMLSTGIDTKTMPYAPYAPCPPCKKVNEPEFGHPGTQRVPCQCSVESSPKTSKIIHSFRASALPPLLAHCSCASAIRGYAGFVPRFTWVMGMNYRDGVQQAMDEFNKNQFLIRNPVYPLGERLPKQHWPDTKVYHSQGLIPFYTGFIPTLRETYGLTFGSSTRKAYRNEQKRRNNAL